MEEPPLEWNGESAIILAIMRLEAKLDRILDLLEVEFEEEKEELDA